MYQKAKLLGVLLIVLIAVGCSSENSTSKGTNIDTEFLPVDKAFKYSAVMIDEKTIKASWDIADGYHLYKNKLKFEITAGGYQVANVDYPESVMLDDKIFGKQESYKNSLDVIITLAKISDGGAIKLKSGYQGCAAQGLCYPPESKVSEFDVTQI